MDKKRAFIDIIDYMLDDPVIVKEMFEDSFDDITVAAALEFFEDFKKDNIKNEKEN